MKDYKKGGQDVKDKYAELEDKYKRSLADYQNLLKRTAKEKEEFAKYAQESCILEILPVYDNLKKAIAHAGTEKNNNWIDGIKYVVRQFKDALSSLGVEEIAVAGEKFTHETMEAVESREAGNEAQDGRVAEVAACGYRLKSKVIVPAKVAVYKFKKEEK